MDMLTQLYRAHDPAERKDVLIVFIRPNGKGANTGLPSEMPITELVAATSVQHELDRPCRVEVTENGRLRIFDIGTADLAALSSEAIVYVYEDGTEKFYVGGKTFAVINPAPTYASIFARPTFTSLEAALERYRTHVAPNTTCFILSDVWSESKRLFLKAKPEAIMRRSLHQHLRTSFTDAEVRPEQVVDESHPVDIKVTWADTNRRAIIEIKWLGKSRNDDGTLATPYSEARAREGAQQLADYLDSDRTAGPGLQTKGYLIVFDARRRGLNENSSTINADDGLFYRDRDITYNPAFHETRNDFAKPVRFFADPILN